MPRAFRRFNSFAAVAAACHASTIRGDRESGVQNKEMGCRTVSSSDILGTRI